MGSARSGLYVEAIRKAVGLIEDRPVFAGAIGPFSLAARLLDVTEIMMECYDEPDMVHIVMEKATSFLTEYCKAYKEAGANGIVLAEPVTGLLSPALAEEFSAPYVKRLVDAVQDDSFVIIYHNCGNNTIQMIDSILDTGAAAYHFGNAIDMAQMLARIPAGTCGSRRGVLPRHAGIHPQGHAAGDGKLLPLSEFRHFLRLRYPAHVEMGEYRCFLRGRAGIL